MPGRAWAPLTVRVHGPAAGRSFPPSSGTAAPLFSLNIADVSKRKRGGGRAKRGGGEQGGKTWMTVNPPREYPRSRGVVPWVWEWFSPQSVYSACLGETVS